MNVRIPVELASRCRADAAAQDLNLDRWTEGALHRFLAMSKEDRRLLLAPVPRRTFGRPLFPKPKPQ